jgi:hypothetical protein
MVVHEDHRTCVGQRRWDEYFAGREPIGIQCSANDLGEAGQPMAGIEE